ncbi:MAG: hypothetical protein HY058_04625 [Proteobacteria bacterium]|nr:hypothetical protein [Pseudomonadota bacterium]
MKILSAFKLIAVTILAVAIFYVGGMAGMQALHYYGNFEWAVTTAAFWLGGLLMVLVVVESVKRTIVAIASLVEDEVPPAPQAASESDADAGPLAKPVQRPPAPPPSAAKPAQPASPPKPAASAAPPKK